MKIKVSELKKLIREAANTVTSGGKDFEMPGEKEEDKLTDFQYSQMARRITDKYQAAAEADWDKAVSQMVHSMKATNGVVLDPEKLRKAIDDDLELRKQIFGVDDAEEWS